MSTPSADVRRSPLEREADAIDCDLYRIYCRVERLYEAHRVERDTLYAFMSAIRHARPHIRSLMHDFDRERTI